MSLEQFIQTLKQKKIHPTYCICGEETFFVNQCVEYIEHELLTEAEKQFDLSVFYGKDASFEQVFNACRTPAMFSSFKVVLLKDAQLFKDLKRFETYLQKPLSQTLFFIVYRDKVLDTKTALGTLLKTKTQYVAFPALKEMELLVWVKNYLAERGFMIQEKALFLLLEQVNHDIEMIVNELQKLIVNQNKKDISIEAIEEFVGISKEYNIFELQDALGKKDKKKCSEIMKHFIEHPKQNPFMLLHNVLYKFFSKVLIATENKQLRDIELAPLLGVSPYAVRNYTAASKYFSIEELEKTILLLSAYNLKALGINTSSMTEEALKKEFLSKLFSLYG